jgi:exodeoxyribonuclease III
MEGIRERERRGEAGTQRQEAEAAYRERTEALRLGRGAYRSRVRHERAKAIRAGKDDLLEERQHDAKTSASTGTADDRQRTYIADVLHIDTGRTGPGPVTGTTPVRPHAPASARNKKRRAWSKKAKRRNREDAILVHMASDESGDLSRETTPEKRAVKCLLWNMNGARSLIKKGIFIEWLQAKNPDVLVIPEFRCSFKQFIRKNGIQQALKDLGLVHHVLHATAHNVGFGGVLILSKYKPLTTGVGVGDVTLDREGRLAWMEFDDFFLVGAYAPASGRPGELQNMDKRLKWDKCLRETLTTTLVDKPHLLMGDLNVAAELEDAAGYYWRADKFPSVTQRERDSYKQLLTDVDLVDLHHHFHKDPAFTWWRHKWDKKKNRGMRLDYILPSRTLVERGCFESYDIQTDVMGSDHVPLGTEGHLFLLDVTPVWPVHMTTQENVDSIPVAVVKSACPTPHHEPLFGPPPKAEELADPQWCRDAHLVGGEVDDTVSPEGDTQTLASVSDNTADSVIPRIIIALREEGKSPHVAMVDSGSFASLCSTAWLEAHHPHLHMVTSGHRPTFKTASKQFIRPRGHVELPFYINGTRFKQHLWVMDNLACDIILGGSFLKRCKASLNYETLTLHATSGKGKRCEAVFVEQPTPLSAIVRRECNLVTVEPITLKPLHEARILVRAPKGFVFGEERPFGTVRTSDRNPNSLCAKGVTELVQGHSMVKVMNPFHDRPITIDRGTPVASFTHDSASAYEEYFLDLTTLSSVTEGADDGVVEACAIQSTEGVSLQDSDNSDRYDPVDANGVPSADLPPLTVAEVAAMSKEDVEEHFSKRPFSDMPTTFEQWGDDKALELKKLLIQHRQVFAINDKDPGDALAPPFRIPTDGCAPIAVPHRPTRPNLRPVLRKHIDEMLKYNIIEHSQSPWASAVVMVPKKDGSIRICVDYRLLNKHTIRSQYPMTRIDDALSSLDGAKFFSAADCNMAYHQIPIAPEDRAKTAFRSPSGLYQFKKMAFGLCGAPAAYSAFMNHALGKLNWESCIAYLDDILVFSPTWEQHMKDLDALFMALKKYNIHLKSKKCHFAVDSVAFLGHVVSDEGVKPDPDKVKSILQAEPTTKDQCRAWHGLASYYRKFIDKFAKRVKPLTEFMNSKKHFPKHGLPPEVQACIGDIKRYLTSEPILLNHPDFSKPFKVHTDASGNALGATLCQDIDGKERVVMYISRALREHEKGYIIYELEALAVVWAMGVVRPYVIGTPVTVVTDNQALLSLFKKKDSSRLLRWIMALQEYDITWVHRRSSQHGDADGLSRMNTNPPETSFGEKHEVDPLSVTPNRGTPNFGVTAVAAIHDEHGDLKFDYAVLAMLSSSADQAAPPIMAAPLHWGLRTRPGVPEPPKHQEPPDYDQGMVQLPTLRELVEAQRADPEFEATITALLASRNAARDAARGTGGEKTPSLRRGAKVVVDGHGPATILDHNADASYKVRYPDGTVFQSVNPTSIRTKKAVQVETKVVIEGRGKERFFLNPNGVLMRRSSIPTKLGGTVDTASGTKVVEQICVPTCHRRAVLYSCHGVPMAGHDGVSRTKMRLRSAFYWHGFEKSVSQWVKSCLFCQKRKHHRPLTHGKTHPMLASRPWEMWAFDLVGPFPESNPGGNLYLLTAVDVFTRYPLAIPVANKSIKTVASALHKHLVTVFGPPKLLLSDMEKSFVSAVVKQMYSKMGVSKIATTGYQPTGNGAVERFHRWLNCTLTMFVNSRKDDWDENIDSILFAYRTSVCGPTGHTPFELGFGRKPTMPTDLQYEIDPQQLQEESDRGLHVSESMRDAYRFVRDRQMKAAQRNKDRRDLTQEHVQFLDGDPVMVFDYIHEVDKGAPKGLRKLKYRFSGPHTIQRRDPASELHYFVREASGKLRKVHVNRLRLYSPIAPALAPACGEQRFAPARVPGVAEQTEDLDIKPKKGDLVIIGCEPDDIEGTPWAVAKVTNRTREGELTVRWFGNNYGRVTGTWRPGFFQPRDDRRYYKAKKDHPSHLPYTSLVSNTPLDDSHIVAFGFQLNPLTDRLPHRVLSQISASTHVAWELPVSA